MKKCKCDRLREAVKHSEIRGRYIMENCPECNESAFRIEMEAQGLNDVYEHLKKKIQDSIND